MQACNGDVRANSLELLVEAFPLLDLNYSHEERDKLMQKQFDILQVREKFNFAPEAIVLQHYT